MHNRYAHENGADTESTTPETFFINTRPNTEADLRALQAEDCAEMCDDGQMGHGNYTDPEDVK